MTALSLFNLLSELPMYGLEMDDTSVECNTVGNLKLTDSSNKYLGYIDMRKLTIELQEDKQ